MSDPKTASGADFPVASAAAAAGEDSGRGVMPIEEFTALASKLVGFSMYKEAIGLYETAVRLYPDNLAIKINLARVREMKRRNDEKLIKELESDIEDKREREDILAHHAFGLGYLHYRRGELDRAREMFEFARSANPRLYAASLFLAKIHVGRSDSEAAIAALEEARRANPFSEETQSLLGRLHMERGDNLKAAHALCDALILSGDLDLAHQPFYRQALGELVRRLGWSDADLPPLIMERGARFNNLSDRVDKVRRDRLSAGSAARLGSLFQSLREPARPPAEALALRRFAVLEKASEEDLAAVWKTLKREEYADGARIFAEQTSTRRLYFVDKGRVHALRATPFGDIRFATFEAGQVFGEMDFLDGHGHSTDARAEGATVLLVLSNEDAQRLFETRKALAVQCLSHFWRTLSDHIRDTTEQMKSFFASEAAAAPPRLDTPERAKAESVIIDIDRKIQLFREKGLSAGELKILATLSTEERYPSGALIFAEGDRGTKLYIVLDGHVRISKTIPGVGEEALAILEHGDFFGEMALVDDKPRSADARAHDGESTVLAIDKRVLEDILSTDLKSAEQFLSIICRILCQRLREINETIVKWKIMSGGF